MPTTWPFPWPTATTPPPATTTAPPGTTAPPTDDGWPAQWAQFEDDTLTLTNQKRSQGAVCGDQTFGPAPPLTYHPLLRRAARGHSRDMGQRNYFSHVSPEGATPSDRAKAVGYQGGVGENIYAGPSSAAEAVDGWMKSPGHCQNIMSPKYKTLGVGYAAVNGSQYGRYWTQNFGM